MSEQPSIFSNTSDIDNIKKRRAFKRMRVAQILALITALFMCISTSPMFGTFAIGTFVTACAMLIVVFLSYQWPYPFLIIYSIFFTVGILFFLLFLFVFKEIYADKMDVWVMLIAANTIYLIADIFIIRGTIAAKKYTQLKKQQP